MLDHAGNTATHAKLKKFVNLLTSSLEDITLSDLNYPAALTMALAGGRIQVGLNKTGTSAQVPNDYRAKLMFYMNSKYTVYNHQFSFPFPI